MTVENNRWNHERSVPVAKLIGRMMEGGDPYTVTHQERVAKLARSIAERMALATEQVELIEQAASIHDLGKNKIDAVILSKPGKLTKAEHAVIETHARRGYKILEGLFSTPIADIVHQHHERLDGSGYPCGATEADMLLEARVLAVADVVEAMASDRPYRRARGLTKALAEVKEGAGTRFDPKVVEACLWICGGGFNFDGEEQ